MSTILELPDGTQLVAEAIDNPDYPGIEIQMMKTDGSMERLCFAEYNKDKPDNMKLCIGAYSEGIDEPVYYSSYMPIEIVKIQLPLYGEPFMLVYNEDHSIQARLPLTDKVKAELGRDAKGYFSVTVGSDGIMTIHERVEEQDW